MCLIKKFIHLSIRTSPFNSHRGTHLKTELLQHYKLISSTHGRNTAKLVLTPKTMFYQDPFLFYQQSPHYMSHNNVVVPQPKYNSHMMGDNICGSSSSHSWVPKQPSHYQDVCPSKTSPHSSFDCGIPPFLSHNSLPKPGQTQGKHK